MIRRSTTVRSRQSGLSTSYGTKNRGFGGFPYPTRLLHKWFKSFRRPWVKPQRTMTISHSQTVISTDQSGNMDFGKTLTYFSETFNAIIGRNSKFYSLTDEHLEELGGVEFRALNALLWILPVVSNPRLRGITKGNTVLILFISITLVYRPSASL